MELEERQDVFINAYSKDFPEYLIELEKIALSEDVPIIRKGSQQMIRFLLAEKNPTSILEIGTAVGFSSLLMAHYTDKNTKITTIENYDKRIKEAKENFKKYDTDKKITLLEGDARIEKAAGGIVYMMMSPLDAPFVAAGGFAWVFRRRRA